MNISSDMPRLYTKEEIAAHFRVTVYAIDKWMQKGKVTPIKMGRRCLFDIAAINEAAGNKSSTSTDNQSSID